MAKKQFCVLLLMSETLTLKKEAVVLAVQCRCCSVFHGPGHFIPFTLCSFGGSLRDFIYFNALDPANSCGE